VTGVCVQRGMAVGGRITSQGAEGRGWFVQPWGGQGLHGSRVHGRRTGQFVFHDNANNTVKSDRSQGDDGPTDGEWVSDSSVSSRRSESWQEDQVGVGVEEGREKQRGDRFEGGTAVD